MSTNVLLFFHHKEARHKVIAEVQRIIFNEFVREMLGETVLQEHGIKPLTKG